jgi:hypothetical protein
MNAVCELNWHLTPFREQRWIDLWEPAAETATDYGAIDWWIYRSVDDPLLFRQVTVWKKKEDFESWWFSEEISAVRTEIITFYDKPLLPSWCTPITGSITG